MGARHALSLRLTPFSFRYGPWCKRLTTALSTDTDKEVLGDGKISLLGIGGGTLEVSVDKALKPDTMARLARSIDFARQGFGFSDVSLVLPSPAGWFDVPSPLYKTPYNNGSSLRSTKRH